MPNARPHTCKLRKLNARCGTMCLGGEDTAKENSSFGSPISTLQPRKCPRNSLRMLWTPLEYLLVSRKICLWSRVGSSQKSVFTLCISDILISLLLFAQCTAASRENKRTRESSTVDGGAILASLLSVQVRIGFMQRSACSLLPLYNVLGRVFESDEHNSWRWNRRGRSGDTP